MNDIVPIPIIDETLDDDHESLSFRANLAGGFALDIRANHGTGAENLIGTFYLRHRVDPDADMERVDGYDFPAQPAGTIYRHVEPYIGAHTGEYDIEFVHTSGSGAVRATVHVPGGIL